jgi:serine/threonine protein kinase
MKNNQMSQHELNTEKRHLSRLPWSPFLAGAVTGVSDHTNLSLVLELMPYGSFHHLIDRFGPFTPTEACFYYCNLVCAIGFIHSHGLVSRDIKPANFLVGPDGYLVMTDLGIAERARAGGLWQDMGTIEYMAPELIQQGYTVGTTVDWWSSGVVLYEMLTQTMVRFNRPVTRYPRVHCCRI